MTGTTNFAAMTVAADRQFTLQFDGVLTMTHHATNLDLPGEANITTAAGDVATFQSTGSNTVQCINYTRADGTGIAGGAGTAILGSDADNVLRWMHIQVDGNASALIDCAPQVGAARFNITTVMDQTKSSTFGKSGSDTVGSGATEVTYSLNSGGNVLTIDLVENVTSLLYADVTQNGSGTADLCCQSLVDSDNITIAFSAGGSVASFDLTGMSGSEWLSFRVAYIAGGSG